MAVTAVSGTQSATVTTEHTLADTSTAGTYQLSVSIVNMVAGDSLELRLYKMVLTGGVAGAECAYLGRYQGAPSADDKVQISVPISTSLTDSGAIRATLKQTAGTTRNFKWTLEKFA